MADLLAFSAQGGVLAYPEGANDCEELKDADVGRRAAPGGPPAHRPRRLVGLRSAAWLCPWLRRRLPLDACRYSPLAVLPPLHSELMTACACGQTQSGEEGFFLVVAATPHWGDRLLEHFGPSHDLALLGAVVGVAVLQELLAASAVVGASSPASSAQLVTKIFKLSAIWGVRVLRR